MSEACQHAPITAGLEAYEWDNIWFEHAEDAAAKRVLVIGDSISCGYRPKLNARLGSEIHVDGIGTSRAVDNRWLIPLLDVLLAQRSDYGAVIFNSGLHGFHLRAEEFARGYEAVCEHLRSRLPHAALILPTITPLRKEGDLNRFDDREEAVEARNKAICAYAKRSGARLIDFHQALYGNGMLYRPDGVHLSDFGYELLAGVLEPLVRASLS